MKKLYGSVVIEHGGLAVETLLELKERDVDGTWTCNIPNDAIYNKGAVLWCQEKYIEIINKEDCPEYFL